MAKKKKIKLSVKNGMRDKIGTILGSTDTNTKQVRINVKAHKGNKKRLASTIKHELMHAKHPNMTEKQVYKKTGVQKITPQEQSKLLAKLRHKSLNYKVGAAKRKFKLGRDKVEPGKLISELNAQKAGARQASSLSKNPPERTAIMGAA